MKLHELAAPAGARHERKRIGRGIGSGLGKTAGKGHKGQKARSGGGKGPVFEGGQTTLARRLPKRGFNNIFKRQFAVVNIGDLERFESGTVVNLEVLKSAGLVKRVENGIKVLGTGELTKALTVQVAAASKTAADKIEKAGGKVEVI